MSCFLGRWAGGDLLHVAHVLPLTSLDLAARGDARVVLNGVIATARLWCSGRVYISFPPIVTYPRALACIYARMYVYMRTHVHAYTRNTQDVFAIGHTFPPYAPARVAGYVSRVSYGTLWGMLDVTQARLPCVPQQWDRESALHGERRQDGRRSDQFFIRARASVKRS